MPKKYQTLVVLVLSTGVIKIGNVPIEYVLKFCEFSFAIGILIGSLILCISLIFQKIAKNYPINFDMFLINILFTMFSVSYLFLDIRWILKEYNANLPYWGRGKK